MHKRSVAKRYEELTFADDFMFGKVMEDKELCREVLECLLQEPVGELTEMQTQRQFCYTRDGKPIRLDLYAGNEEILYDAEMQQLNHKKLSDLELPKRSRFYQSVMDADFLQKGQSYRKLPEGRVLFICTFDPFEKNLPVYRFRNHCVEDPEITLSDGTEKLFFNCTCQSEDMPENLRRLYGYIIGEAVSDELTERIDEAVKHGRRNEEWRSEYMKELLHDDDIRTDALAEGRELGRSEGIELGRSEGIELGRSEGIELGRSEGIELGRAEGLSDGIELGRSEGMKLGRAEGLSDGMELGRSEGIELGRQRERTDSIRLFIQDKLEDGITEDKILGKLIKLYSLTQEEAAEYLERSRRE